MNLNSKAMVSIDGQKPFCPIATRITTWSPIVKGKKSQQGEVSMNTRDHQVKVIAATIFQQLGGAGFAMMIGLIKPITVRHDEKEAEVTASFHWRAVGKNHLNCMEVTLVEALDTYRVVFGVKKNGQFTPQQQPLDDVYCEDLQPIFEDITGLVTIPPRIIINGIDITERHPTQTDNDNSREQS